MIEETKQYKIRNSLLEGTVKLSGAKNSALRLLAASILTNGNIELENYPSGLLDAQIHVEMLRALGKNCKIDEDNILVTESKKLKSILDWKGRSIRNTLLILGALVARNGEGAVPLPGGCKIGERKFDLHEMLLKRLGAEVWSENNMLCAEVHGRLQGNDIHFPMRSTGATENSILCGCLAEGVTRVWNPHIRPEIMDLIELLKKMGAKITVYGQEHIEIQGVECLNGAKHSVIADNMEALTWLVGSVVTNGDVEIHGFPFEDVEVPLIFFRESGARFYAGNNSLIVRGGRCYPVDLSTGPYPGINSDMQPLFAAYALRAQGVSHIIDLRFPGRYNYAEELAKMGARFEIKNNILSITGGQPLKGSTVTASDLRAGAGLCLAAFFAQGETVINDGWQIDRGYDKFSQKVLQLGGKIERII